MQGIFLIITFVVLAANFARRHRLRRPRPAHPAGGLTDGRSSTGPTHRRRPASRPSRPRRRAGGATCARRSPKILIGLVILLASSSCWRSSVRGSRRTTRRAGPSIGRQRQPSEPERATTGSARPSRRRTSGPSCWPAPGRPSSCRSWPASIATVLSVVIGITAGYLGGWVDDFLSMLANIFLVLPALPLLIVVGSFLGPRAAANALLIGADHRAHRLGLGGPGAAGPDAVAAQPGLRRGGPDQRREDLAIIIVRDPAQPGGGHRLVVPVHRRCTRSAPTSALGFLGVRQPGGQLELGNDPVRRHPGQAVASGQWWWYIPPGIVHRPARHQPGADQLRHRRVHQPAAARVPGCPARRPSRPAVRRRPQLGFTPVVRRAAEPRRRRRSSWRSARDRAERPRSPPRARPADGELLLEIRGLSVDYGARRRRGARGQRRRPDDPARRGGRPGRRERQRQVDARLRRDPAAARPGRDRRRRGVLPLPRSYRDGRQPTRSRSESSTC